MMMNTGVDQATPSEAPVPVEAPPVVHVVDDDDAMRKMTTLLTRSVGLDAMAHPSAEAFHKTYDPGRPGCLVLDVRMAGMSGLELQRQLAAQRIRIPIIMITGHGDVSMAVEAMRLGALDFIEKPFREAVLLERIRQAIAQDAEDRREHAKRAEVLARLALLTDREREVLDLMVIGRASKQIAAELCISCKTVEKHRLQVIKKMQVHSTAELVYLVCMSGTW